MADCILNVEDINVYYGAIHAIKDVSFRVFDGEIVALIGANGAGKSTTLKTVSGLLRSNTGSIEFMGEDIMRTPADKLVSRGLAHVPEGRRVFAQMTVEENLEMGAYTRPNAEIAPGLERVYAHFPRLKERRKQVAGTLSGGRAADARHGSRPYEQPPSAHARRALHGPGAHSHRADLPDREGAARGGYDDSARRAECPRWHFRSPPAPM